MGLIRAAMNAMGGTLRDQYKEFITCDSLPTDVLVRKGQNKLLAGGTNRGNDNIITDGSRIAVADGQCLIIVEDGKIVDFCAETGEYIYKTGTSPSMLTGGFEGLKKSFTTLWNRTQSGGQQDHDQRVYYVNMKEIMGNKFGVGEVPFRDSEFNFTVKIRCYGQYSYKITDPLMFYTNVCGNVSYEYRRNEEIDSQFKSEIQNNLQFALGQIALRRIPYDQLTNSTKEIADALNAEMSEKWVQGRGISVVSLSITVTPDPESEKKIAEFQSTRVYTDTRMLGARLGQAQANAMESAAQNTGGVVNAFMGIGMVQQAGGMNAAQLFNMGNQQPVQQQTYQQDIGSDNVQTTAGIGESSEGKQPTAVTTKANTVWKCQCGVENSGKFCIECGTAAPVPTRPSNLWICSCGAENSGKFCMECGTKKPLDSKCESCGFEGDRPFKFCPECGAENKI